MSAKAKGICRTEESSDRERYW